MPPGAARPRLPLHLDGRLQLGHELVVNAPGHLGLQFVEAAVAVGEPLVAAKREGQG